ncbi:hypothetical protein VNI00_016973 [Paramarasmius palmivorus]|uniref:F-box domain-containing protein n=1 Tax=Paramarasmius palmivorus TaxID=297713 RepID=A0AAW0BD05_9AGAR
MSEPPPPALEVRSNAASPIQALPPEILSKILTLIPRINYAHSYHWNMAKLEYKSEFRVRSESSYYAPSYSLGSDLGRVCHTWRNVSLSTPALWSYIWLDVFDQYPHPECAMERLQAHLERSKVYPLTITLNLFSGEKAFGEFMTSSEETDAGSKPVSWSLLKLVLNHGSRIRSLCLHSDDALTHLLAAHLIPHIRSRVTNLEYLSMALSDEGYVKDTYCVAEAFKYSELPLLRRFDNCEAYGQPRFPTTHLTHITIDRMNLANFYKILCELPYLTSLEVDRLDSRWITTVPDNITIPSPLCLHTLCVGFNADTHFLKESFDRFTRLVNLLNCPFLTTLSIGGPHEDSSESNSDHAQLVLAFNSFIKRSPNIERFRLHSDLKAHDVIGLLRKMPHLITLELGHEEITEEFWLEIGNGDFVPKLRDLRFEIRSGHWDWLAFGEMIQQRKNRGLWSAYVELRNETVPELDIRLLEALQVEGLAVRVVHSSYSWGNEKVELLGYRIES